MYTTPLLSGILKSKGVGMSGCVCDGTCIYQRPTRETRGQATVHRQPKWLWKTSVSFLILQCVWQFHGLMPYITFLTVGAQALRHIPYFTDSTFMNRLSVLIQPSRWQHGKNYHYEHPFRTSNNSAFPMTLVVMLLLLIRIITNFTDYSQLWECW